MYKILIFFADGVCYKIVYVTLFQKSWTADIVYAVYSSAKFP
jgi:hypothetical protein